jgi:iron complex outermembrane receptor protein
VVEEEDIQMGRPTVTLQESLVRVPGVLVRNQFNFAQDLRMSIRGFGARSAFGIRGIQVYVDGIPQTLPDGQTQMDAIDPASIERIEVMRGPMSALYGNSSGGIVNIITQGGPQFPFAEFRQTIGEFGLFKSLVQTGGQTDRTNYFFNLSRVQIDGFREHSEAETRKLNGKVRFQGDESSNLTLLVNSVRSPRLEDPGGLTREQAGTRPSQASPLSLRFDTREEISNDRVGFVYRNELTPFQNLEAVGYFSLRDLDNATPFRFVELQREVYGGRMQYDIRSEALGIPHRFFAGVDVQFQNDDRRNFDNEGGSPGGRLLLDQGEEVTSMGLYLQEEIKLADHWSLVVGGRYDRVNFEVDDRLVADADDSGSKTFDQATGRMGLNYFPISALKLYANVAQSFETPTATELVNRPEGGGGINQEIEPQKAINYEMGLKGMVGDRFAYEAALFTIRLSDELIPFRDQTDRVFYRNAGESTRTGAELGASLEIVKGVKASLAYTYLNSQFDTYLKEGRDLKGNDVPGLPRHQLYGELLYKHPSGFYSGIDVLYLGELFLNDENTEKDTAHTVVDLRVGHTWRWGKWEVNPFFGVQNLLNETYSSNVRINASGGRFFEPAPGRNAYGGLGVVHRW